MKGAVFAISPASNQDITRTSCSTREEMSCFLEWSESSTGSSLVENITKLIVPGDPLLIFPASKGMISHTVSFSKAGRAGAIGSIDLEAEAVLEAGQKLRGRRCGPRAGMGTTESQSPA